MPGAVAIVPARGGSKRIPRKNIRDFMGRPALSWPISAAQSAGCFDRIVVTTDDDEIAAVARDQGAETPFVRSPDLSGDYAGTTEVIRDAVRRMNLAPETLVCCIYATALFVRSDDLAEGRNRLVSGATWAFSVAEYPTPIDRAYKQQDGRLVARNPEKMPERSQDLEPAYFDVGQFYWARAATWLDAAARVWDGAEGVTVPFSRAIDIDTPEDWARAETLYSLMRD